MATREGSCSMKNPNSSQVRKRKELLEKKGGVKFFKCLLTHFKVSIFMCDEGVFRVRLKTNSNACARHDSRIPRQLALHESLDSSLNSFSFRKIFLCLFFELLEKLP